MQVSLGEIQTIIYRSGLAIDLPVGIAVDISLAARRMLSDNFGSLVPFVKAFNYFAHDQSDEFKFYDATKGIFYPKSEKKLLSSLFAGPSACDLLSVKHSESELQIITLNIVDIPVVILYQALVASNYLKVGITLSWHGSSNTKFEAICWEGSLSLIEGNVEELFKIIPAKMILSTTIDKPNISSFISSNSFGKAAVEIDKEIWGYFLELADCLLVEATEASRLTGAGARINDND
tara:strand:+ start:45 stop:749 length:705 start_codon:yes stop_codon:yes gene_type:complete